MAPQRRGRARGIGLYGRSTRASGVPSPLGQSQVSSSSSMSQDVSSSPSTPIEENDCSGTSGDSRKRKWSSPIWHHYDTIDGDNYDDGIFRAFYNYCKEGPILAISDLHLYLYDNVKFMSRNTAKNYRMKIHEREKKKLTEEIGKLSRKNCLTCDMWTSCVGQGYLSLTAHYVDDEWKLHAKILNFYHLEPPHDALNMHGKLIEFIKEWEITKKVFTVTLDNARCNDNMQNLLAASLKVHSPLHRDGKFFHVHCGAHILNLIVQEGLKLVDGGVAKIKKLVIYIGCSERRKLKFKENVISCGLDCSKGLYVDCPTRWNSTFKMLCRALYFREAYSSMSLSSRYDVRFPSLPTEAEWVRINKICALLNPFDEITTLMSGRNYPTSNLYLKSVWKIECLLLEYASCEDEFVRVMAQTMKFQFVGYCFTELDFESAEIKSNLYVHMDPCVNENSQVTRVQDELPGFAAFANNVQRVSSTQLDLYLEETRVDHTLEIDILLWWKENEKRYPIVATMARDILAIPVTTVASESAFSMGSRLISNWRSSLKPDTANALLTTRTWLYGFQVKEGPVPEGYRIGYLIPLLDFNDSKAKFQEIIS
ncbi:hypothetical protein RND81_12G071600 [Saponaria officinalis]|uniref:Transposase n=1 Tax=Saponaria officinalis TaxID=3572 RepID=A0AAW1H7K8_SAPOF